MKKFLCVLLSAILVIGLAACGGSASSSTPPAESASTTPTESTSTDPVSETSEETPDKTIKVGISLALTDDFTENLRKVYESMAPEYGLEITYTNAGGDSSVQLADVEALIAQQLDVIILRCVDSDAGNMLSEMVHAAGIPCVIDETKPNENRDYDVNVAGDQIIHGNLVGEYLQKYLDENPDVTCNMLYINGGTSDNIRKRMNGIFDTCTSDRLVQIGDELGSWSASTAQEITEAYLVSQPDMNVIACANDEMALAVIETLKGAGRLDDVMVFGVDGSASGQAAVKAGEMTATTFNDVSKQIAVIYECCVKLVNGEDISGMFTNTADKEIDPKAYILLTAENIDAEGTV